MDPGAGGISNDQTDDHTDHVPGQINVQLENNASSGPYIATSGALNPGQWYHIVVKQ